jgi:hypothetical protein
LTGDPQLAAASAHEKQKSLLLPFFCEALVFLAAKCYFAGRRKQRQMVRLSAVAGIRLGHPFRGAVPVDAIGAERVVQSRDLAEAHGQITGALVRTNLSEPYERVRLRAGDVVLQSRGNRFPAAVVAPDADGAILAAPLYMIRPDCTRAAPTFLVFALNAAPMQARLRASATGSHIPQVPAEAIRALTLPLPPLRDQHALAALSALADEEARLVAALAAHRSARLYAHALKLDEARADRNSRRHANAPG